MNKQNVFLKLQNNFNPFSHFGVGSNPEKGFSPIWGLGSEKMNPPNLRYNACCGTCRFARENFEGKVHCTKYKLYNDVEQICDEYEG